jgi:hypothetical protein
VTDTLIECRDFSTRWFGFRVVFEATWFVYLKPSDESPHGIAFMTPDHPSQPPGPEAFDGQCILLTFQVSEAASEFERVRKSGLFIDHPLREKPWGQRRSGRRVLEQLRRPIPAAVEQPKAVDEDDGHATGIVRMLDLLSLVIGDRRRRVLRGCHDDPLGSTSIAKGYQRST